MRWLRKFRAWLLADARHAVGEHVCYSHGIAYPCGVCEEERTTVCVRYRRASAEELDARAWAQDQITRLDKGPDDEGRTGS